MVSQTQLVDVEHSWLQGPRTLALMPSLSYGSKSCRDEQLPSLPSVFFVLQLCVQRGHVSTTQSPIDDRTWRILLVSSSEKFFSVGGSRT